MARLMAQTTARTTWRAKPRQKPRDWASELAEAEARVAKTRRFLDRIKARIADRIASGEATETWPNGKTTTYWMDAARKWEDGQQNVLEHDEWQVADLKERMAA
jgi:hypothetical protein